MPLIQSTSKSAFSANVATEMSANPSMSQQQAVAIAYSEKRSAQKAARRKNAHKRKKKNT